LAPDVDIAVARVAACAWTFDEIGDLYLELARLWLALVKPPRSEDAEGA